MGDKSWQRSPGRMRRQAQDVGVGVGQGLKAEWEELSVSGAGWSWSLLWMLGSGAEGASWRQAAGGSKSSSSLLETRGVVAATAADVQLAVQRNRQFWRV